jgi:uncharacterized RDD family membrane protein YckC
VTHATSGAGAGPPRFAGLATRTLAFAVDAAVINAVAWLLCAVVALGMSLFAIPDEVRAAIAAIGAAAAVAWTVGYFVFFWSASGQTPGNRLFGIAVHDGRSGRPLRARRAAVRVLALLLSALPLCAGFLMILVDDRRRALHDRLVGTVVTEEPGRPRSPRAPRTTRFQPVDELPTALRDERQTAHDGRQGDGHVRPRHQRDSGKETEASAHD